MLRVASVTLPAVVLGADQNDWNAFANLEWDAFTTLADYEAELNLSCETDSDCAITNVGNCCGFYPTCTNAEESGAAPDLVNLLCEQNGLVSVCGYPSISGCQCIDGTCTRCKYPEGCIQPGRMIPDEFYGFVDYQWWALATSSSMWECEAAQGRWKSYGEECKPPKKAKQVKCDRVYEPKLCTALGCKFEETERRECYGKPRNLM